jgi:hypothetical protein
MYKQRLCVESLFKMVATKRKTNGDASPVSKKAKIQAGGLESAHAKPPRSEKRTTKAEVLQDSSSGSGLSENEVGDDDDADALPRTTSQPETSKGVNGVSSNGRHDQPKRAQHHSNLFL